MSARLERTWTARVARAVALVPECRTIGDHKSHSRNSPLPPRVSGWLLPPAFHPGTARTTGLSRGFDRDAGRLRARANRSRRARRPDGAQALIAAVWLVSSDAAKGGARSARSRNAARAARIARIAAGSSRGAIKRRRPPHRGQASTSISNARLIRSAHAQ